MRTADVDDFGDRVATLLRHGSGKEYDEVRKFVLKALQSGDPIDGDMIMEIIWSLLPKKAQKKIRREEWGQHRASLTRVSAHTALEGNRLRKVLNEELGMSEAIVRDGHEVMPRFRIFTPSGHFVILMQMSDDASERQRRIRLVGLFMAWKMATGFVLSGELRDPDAISSFAVLSAWG